MKFTIDLNDAQVFIPNGRLMNLKDALKWNKINIDGLEYDIIRQQSNMIEPNLDFDQKIEANLKSFTNNSVAHKNRLANLDSLVAKVALGANISPFVPSLVDELQGEVKSIKDKVMTNPLIIEKMAKLNKLKMINS